MNIEMKGGISDYVNTGQSEENFSSKNKEKAGYRTVMIKTMKEARYR